MAQFKAPKASVRASGGTPAGFPDFVPLNPWGRAMPAPPRRERPDLYQVVVRDRQRGNKEVRVGPQMARDHCETIRAAIDTQICLGREKRWFDPVIVKSTAALGRPVLGV